MRLLLKILFFALLAVAPTEGFCKKKQPYIQTYVDTLMSNLRRYSVAYNSMRPDFDANIFVKGNVDFLRRNRLQQYIPYLNKASKGVNHYYAEFIGGVTFSNPNIYNQTLFSITSNKRRFVERHIETIVAPNLKLNIYAQYLYGNIYSPLAYKSAKYYRYKLDSIWQKENETYYKISFAPKITNFKFVRGYMIATNRNWSVREMKLYGGMEFIEYSTLVQMGKEGTPDEFLPKKLTIETNAKILGNHLYGKYISTVKYNQIKESHFVRGRGREKYDLTLQYKTKVDTLSALANFYRKFRDSVVMADMPQVVKKDSSATVKKPSAMEKMGRFIVSNHSIDLKQVGELNISPLLSPALVDFSSTNGLSYTQKFKYSKISETDKVFKLEPRLGYNFKYKELYWGLKSEIIYAPKKMSRIFIDIGNGNKIHTNRIMDELLKVPFMVFDTSKLNLKHFRNSYARIGHKIEISNGFSIGTNLSFQMYDELHNSDLTVIYPLSQYVKRSKEIARNTYRTFVPEVELTYTPHQYYYYNGNRKVYLYSRFPTFTLGYAKAIAGVMNSTIAYNRLEFDVNQKVAAGPMHQLYYRIGAGLYFNYTDFFFSEFNYMKKNNLPAGWNDDIGGAFQLLRREEYNKFDKYFRVNLRYDAPLILIPSVFRNIKYITREKLYCNMLFTNTMKPYVEMGYGIGSQLFTVGVFSGGEVNKWDKAGVKFTLEFSDF